MKPSQMLKTCLNPKVLIGIGAVIVLVYLFVPQVANYAWVLLAIACPLSMMVMMAGMDYGKDKPGKVFVCPECSMSYKDADWAKKCAAWCKEHHSCNLEITKYAAK